MAPSVSLEWLKLELSNFVYRWALLNLTKRKKSPQKGRAYGHVTYLNYYPPQKNISGMAKARDFKFCTMIHQVAV